MADKHVNEKKKKKRKLKKEAEKVKEFEEGLKNWDRSEFIASKNVEATEEYRRLVEQFKRNPGPLEKPSFFENYKFNPDRLRTVNKEAITKLVVKFIRDLYDVLEEMQLRGQNFGMASSVVLTHNHKMADILFQRAFKMLRMDEKTERQILSLGAGGAMVSFQISKSIKLGWISEHGERSELENLIESMGEVIEGTDKTDNEDGNIAVMGEIILHKAFQVRDCLLKMFMEPVGSMQDARSKQVEVAKDLKDEKMETRGKLVNKQFYEDIESVGLNAENLVAQLDLRPDTVKVNLERGEVTKVMPMENLNCQPLQKEVVNEVKEIVKNLENDLVETLKKRASKKKATKLEQVENESKNVQNLIIVLRLIAGMADKEVMGQAFALFIRQSLHKLEKIVSDENGDETDIEEYARITLLDLRLQYRTALINSIEMASEDTKMRYKRLLSELGLATTDEDDMDPEDVPSNVPDLEELSDAEYEEDEDYKRQGNFGILQTKSVRKFVGKGKNKKLDGSIIQEKIDRTLVDDIVETLKQCIEKQTEVINEKQDILHEKYNQMEGKGYSNDAVAEIKTMQNEIMDAWARKETCVNNVEELLKEVDTGINVQVGRMKEMAKKLDNTEVGLEECKMMMLSSTTTNVAEYVEFATLSAKLERKTDKNIEAITEILAKDGNQSKVLSITGIMEEIKESWTSLSIKKVEVFKKASRKVQEHKGVAKKPSKAAAEAAKWSNEIDHYLEEKKSTESAATIEMKEITRELIERNKVEELINNNYYKTDEETKKVIKRLKRRGIGGSIKIIQILRKAMVQWNQGCEFIALFEQFKDYPKGYIQYCPRDAIGRVDSYEQQKGYSTYAENCKLDTKKSMKKGVFKDIGPDECEESLKEIAEKAVNCGNWEEGGTVRKVVIVLVETKEKGVKKTNKKFLQSLPESSYGRYVQDKRLQGIQPLSEARGKYQAEVVHANSDLRCYYQNPDDELEETAASCGKNCKSSTECGVKIVYPGQTSIQCGQEFVVLAKPDVSAEELSYGLRGYVSYNGSPITLEQRIITVENHRSEMIVISKPFTEIGIENIDEVISFFEENVIFSEILDGYSPKKYGMEDLDSEGRTAAMFRIGCLVAPGWIASPVWLASNALVETGSGDSRVVTPKWNQFILCNHCLKRFQSPISLFMHKLFEEDVLGWASEDGSIDHTKHGQYSICWCRLTKNWGKDGEIARGELAGESKNELGASAGSSIIKPKKGRSHSVFRKVQLAALSQLDAGSERLGNLINTAVLLNQINMFVKMPTENFGTKARLVLHPMWSKGSWWSNLYIPKLMREEKLSASKVLPESWQLAEGSNMRLDLKGRSQEIGICQLFSEVIENSQNTRQNELKMGSIDNKLNGVVYRESEEFIPVESVVTRSSEELEWLANFIDIEDELMNYNVLKHMGTPENVQEDFSSDTFKRKILLGRYLLGNYANSCTIGGRLLSGLFKMPITDAVPYLSLSTPMGMIGNVKVSNKELLKPMVLDFNQDPITKKEIVPGMDLKVTLPAIEENHMMLRVAEGWNQELDQILVNGWGAECSPGHFSKKGKTIPDVKAKKPKIKSTFVESVTRVIPQSEEKQNYDNENVLAQINSWKCETCSGMDQKQPAHKKPGACFDDNPGNKKKKIRASIEKKCAEAKARRIAEEKRIMDENENKNQEQSVNVEDVEEMEDLIEELDKCEVPTEQRKLAAKICKKAKKAAKEKMAEMDMNSGATNNEEVSENDESLVERVDVTKPEESMITNEKPTIVAEEVAPIIDPEKLVNLDGEIIPAIEPEKSKTVLEECEEFMLTEDDTDDDFQTESESVY